MADQTNPFTMMGMAGMMMPNPYTQYKGALPMPGYMGTPTDAQGKPIQSYLDAQAQHDAWQPTQAAPAQGTTLNSNPNWAVQNAMLDSMGRKASQVTTQGGASNDPQTMSDIIGMRGMLGPDPNSNNTGQTGPIIPGYPIGGVQPAQPAPQTNPIDMRQAYLTALANPGKVTTPGANVPIKQPLGTPSVLQSFLAHNPGGGATMPGGYTNKPFFATLNNLQGSAT